MAEHAAYVEFVSMELPGVLQRREEYKASLPPAAPDLPSARE
jgi:hypothetical protein